MTVERKELCDVAIVGGGPAGLTLAAELRHLGVERVIVLEREAEAGGIPRHCGHYPFGITEYNRLLKGPDYARCKVEDAERKGVDLRTGTTVTALHPGGTLELSSHAGTATITARRVVLCTGAREASRPQRFISGSRPQGVITTGALQAFSYIEGLVPFKKPAILGTELVSFSALLTCRHAGIQPVAMIEENPRITARAFSRLLPAVLGVPILSQTKLTRILGKNRVEGIEIERADGRKKVLDADGVICTGRFRPEASLMRNGHLAIDPKTGGPLIDQFMTTSDPSYLCAGNLLRPIETHGWCAEEGRQAARIIVQALGQPDRAEPRRQTPIRITSPAIRYVLPQHLSTACLGAHMPNLQLRLNRPARGRLVISADGKTIWSRSINSVPERRILVPIAPLLAHGATTSITIGLEEQD